jgi:CRP-like cAMP-binding protein
VVLLDVVSLVPVTGSWPSPLYRADLGEAFRRGDVALMHAMDQRQRLFLAKDCIAVAGQSLERVYRLHTGWLCRSRQLGNGKRQILSIFLPGDLVGTRTLLYERQLDTIECLTDATVQWLEQAQLRALVMSQGDVALRVIWQFAEQERRLHNWATGLGKCHADRRMAAMLLDLRLRLQRLNLVTANSYRLPMTRQDIADYLGLTPVHISRVLPRFHRDGLATVQNHVVTLRNTPVLARIASPMLDWCERAGIESELNERFAPDCYPAHDESGLSDGRSAGRPHLTH